MPVRRLLIAAGLATGLLGGRPAAAHQASMTYLDVDVAEDRTGLDFRLRINVRDTAEPLGLPIDTTPADAVIVAGAAGLFDYVLDRIEVETTPAECALERGAVGIVSQRDRFAELRWRLTCPQPVAQLAIEYDLFFDLDPLHTCNLVVRYRGEVAPAPLQELTPRFEWDLGGAPPGAFIPFMRSGILHIAAGFDHLSFLIALLLVAVIARERGGSGLRVRGVSEAIRYTALIATSFTLAHSITLAIAALGWLTLPSRLVESLVAVSIAFVAVENLLRPDPRHRWLLTFGFGLVHGMAFASVLRNQLPPSDVALPLLSFNLGVELGQLAVIAVLVPLLHLLATRVLGPDRYRATAVTYGSAIVALLGLIWFIERAFAVKLLGL